MRCTSNLGIGLQSCISFAAPHVRGGRQTGINTTMIASIMMGLFGDRPGLCNGASGAIAVVVVDLVRTLSA